MRKYLLLLLAFTCQVWAAENEPVSIGYQMVEQGYMDQPISTPYGILATNDRQSEIYLFQNNQLVSLVSTRGCGRYITLNADKHLVGFKSIDDNGYQAPALLNIVTHQITLLEDYTFQCGQVSFSQDDAVAYTMDETLIVLRDGKRQTWDLGFYTNIVRLSPDGQSIAFSNADGQPMVMDLEDGHIHLLSDLEDLYDPKWNQNGTRIVWERGDGSLFVTDPTTQQLTSLGSGFGAQWLDTRTLVYSRSHYINNDVFYFTGISVRSVRWDGSHEQLLVPMTMDCPQQVGLSEDGELLIAYSYGNRRLVRYSTHNQKEETLYTLPTQGHFGFIPSSLKEQDVTLDSSIRKQTSTMGGTIGIYDIPYINQYYDSPDSYAGCHSYGSVACGPTTSCMLLAYLGYFEKHATTSRKSNCAWGQTNYYAWYVGQQYTSNSGNYTFSLAATGRDCSAKGAYGFMWNNGSPSSKMKTFYDKNDIPTAMSSQQWSPSYQVIKAQCDADHPYSWCITSARSNGHLILPFRCDAKCVKVSGQWTLMEGATGSLVVQDPYGDANNTSQWLGDGRYSTYDYTGYNNGYYKMVTAWGVTVTKRKAATAQIKVSPTTLTFKNVNVGDSATKIFSVTGVNLTDSIHMTILGTGTAVFTLQPTILPASGGDVTVIYRPTKAAQREIKVTLISTGAEDVNISISGRAITDIKEASSIAQPQAIKVMEHGQFYIYRSGIKYDFLGNQATH